MTLRETRALGGVGLFLGAGASYEVGMPLVWELTAEIRNWLTSEKLRELNRGWRIQGGGYSDVVVEDFITVLERKDLHYESVLGYLETQFRRQRGPLHEYHGLYAWLVELVYQLLYYRQVNNSAYLDRRLSHYEGIRILAEQNSPLWVFSLNHDVMVEAIAARFSIPLQCGFGPNVMTLPRRDAFGRQRGELRAEVLTEHDLENGAMYFPNPGQQGIYLLKIHGALDVFTFNDGKDLLKLVPTAGGQQAVIDTLRAANEELLYVVPGAPGGKVKATNEIAYADHSGEMQFLRRSLLAGAYKFDARQSQVLPRSLLKHFRANINFVSTLVCIGYGFGDLHINSILREWLEASGDRHLEIVDPIARDVPPPLLHLAPQVTITRSAATDYLDTRVGISRSPRDQLDKRLFSHVRSLGQERTAAAMSEFVRENQKRLVQAFAEKIAQLPWVNGDVDVSAIGPPDEVARKWAAELQGSDDDRLRRLVEFLEVQKTVPQGMAGNVGRGESSRSA